MLKIVYRWHQKVGIWIGLGIIFWGLSGLVHPILSAINPKPVRFGPPNTAMSLAQVDTNALNACVNAFQGRPMRIIGIEKKPVLLGQYPKGFQYCNLKTGIIDSQLEIRYLQSLVSHYLGKNDLDIQSLSFQEQFDEDYLFINRLLPVSVVTLERADNMTVYLDPSTGKLAALVNDTKRLTSSFFRFAHNWLFIGNDTLRQVLMSLFLLAGFSVSAMGLIVYFKKPQRIEGDRTQRWHRQLGLPFAIIVMAFTFSGTYHLWQKNFRELPQTIKNPPSIVSAEAMNIALQALLKSDSNVIRVSTLGQQGNFAFRALVFEQSLEEAKRSKRSSVLYWSTKQQEWLAQQDELFAKQLLASQTQLPIEALSGGELITRFGGEYGFIQKRLPVWKFVHGETGRSFYMDTDAQVLNASFDWSDRLEGWSFAYLHKWSFLDFLGGTVTDIIVSMAALFIVFCLILGTIVYKKKYFDGVKRSS